MAYLSYSSASRLACTPSESSSEEPPTRPPFVRVGKARLADFLSPLYEGRQGRLKPRPCGVLDSTVRRRARRAREGIRRGPSRTRRASLRPRRTRCDACARGGQLRPVSDVPQSLNKADRSRRGRRRGGDPLTGALAPSRRAMRREEAKSAPAGRPRIRHRPARPIGLSAAEHQPGRSCGTARNGCCALNWPAYDRTGTSRTSSRMSWQIRIPTSRMTDHPARLKISRESPCRAARACADRRRTPRGCRWPRRPSVTAPERRADGRSLAPCSRRSRGVEARHSVVRSLG